MGDGRLESGKRTQKSFGQFRYGWQSNKVLAFLAVFYVAMATGSSGIASANNSKNHPLSSNVQVTPTSLNFGTATVGTTIAQSVSLTNTGNNTVNITKASVSSSQFSVSGLNLPLSLSANQSATFQVWFNPTSGGSASGNLTLQTNSGVSVGQVALAGTAIPIPPQASVTPTNLNLGTSTVGTTANAAVTVTNLGGSNLTVSLISVSAGPFGVSGVTTPLTITPGKAAAMNVSYSPTITGTTTGSITITSNDLQNPTSVISLSGTATAAAILPSITTQPASQTVTTGQTATFSVLAAGTAPLTHQWQKNGANISGATAASYTTPATTTSDSGSTISVVVNNSAGTVTSTSATLTVNAAAVPPSITTQPASQTVTAGQAATFSVLAAGTAPLTYQWRKNGANISGATAASYTTPATTTTDSGSTISVVVNNSAGTVTSTSATLTVNAAAAPAIQLSTPSINFGNVVVASNLSQALIISNTGTATLTISQVTAASGAGFSISGFSLPLSISAGQKTTINAVFQPASVGTASGSISIVSNAPTSPSSVSLNGTGIAATLTLGISPTSLSFGSVATGTSSGAQNVTVSNTGNSNVNISQITLNGAGFLLAGGSTPVTLSPAQSLTLSVQFSPTVSGSVSGSISIVSNATGSPAPVSLSGTGVSQVQHSVALSWNASASSVSGYNVYRSTISGSSYTKINASLVGALLYTDSTVLSGTTYYYVTTAVDSSGNESQYSNEVSAPIP